MFAVCVVLSCAAASSIIPVIVFHDFLLPLPREIYRGIGEEGGVAKGDLTASGGTMASLVHQIGLPRIGRASMDAPPHSFLPSSVISQEKSAM